MCMKTVLSFISVLALFFGCSSSSGPKKELSSSALEELIKKGEGYYLIDVRTPQEYESGYIPSAVNIPLDVIDKKIGIEDKKALIILYCRSGNRSGNALNILKGLGYTNVVNFGGVSKYQGKLLIP